MTTSSSPTVHRFSDFPVVPTTSGERAFSRQIRELWIHVQDHEREKQFTDAELEGMRCYLGEKLSGMKELLLMCGRAEQWSGFLHRHRIPQLPAEQLIAEQEAGGRLPQPTVTRPVLPTATDAATTTQSMARGQTTTKKSVEEPDWDAIRRLTPELRKTNFLRHRAELAAQALATGEVTEVIDFGRAL
jgi:hypothetical protein